MANNAQITTLDSPDQATTPYRVRREFNVDVAQSPNSGEVRLQRRYFNEPTWHTVKVYRGPVSEIGAEVEAGVEYRFQASDDFAGQVQVRINRGLS